ncbi:MAG: hypothetical protein JNK58_05870 [Phycisphaerae bacterium]|nr:hypothetical protein [Phycisphaerae bacterium]
MTPRRLQSLAVSIAVLLLAIAPAIAAAPATRDTLTPLLRAIDAADPALAASIGDLHADTIGAGLADPAELFRRASSTPADLKTGLDLVEAAEAWYRTMSADGAARFTMVGATSPATRSAARAVVALAAGATAVLDRAIEAADLASDSGRKPDDDDALSTALHARQIILPLRAARAALVLAASAEDHEQKVRLATLALETTLRVEPVSAWSESERFVVSGWALHLINRHPEALTAFEKARAAANAKDAEPAVRNEALIDAALGESLALLASRGPVTARESMQKRMNTAPFVEQDQVDLWAALAAVDVLMTIAPLEAATFQDASARNAAMAWPWREIEKILPRLAFPQRGAVYAHLAPKLSAVPAAVETLPGAARLAAAWAALAQSLPDHDAAQRTLAPLADPTQAPSDVVHRDASRLFCRAAAAGSDPVVLSKASRVALAFVECCPQEDAVGEMLGASAHAAEKRLRNAPTDDDARMARDDLLASLRALSSAPIRMDDADRDPWRLTLARLLLAMIARAEWSESIALASEARSTLRLVTSPAQTRDATPLLIEIWIALLRDAEESDDEEAPVARVAAELAAMCDEKNAPTLEIMAVGRARSRLAVRQPEQALAALQPFLAPDHPASPLALETGIEAALRMENESEARAFAARLDSAASVLSRLSRRAWHAMEPSTTGFIAGAPATVPPPPIAVFRIAADVSTDADQSAMHRTRLAWSLLLNNRPEEAARHFRDAMNTDNANAGLRRGLGEALLVMNDEEGAFMAFNEIARAFGARQDFTREYWHAWTRMLEILSRRHRTPDEDARIRREIARLRSLDSALEHPDCMVRIKQLEERLK